MTDLRLGILARRISESYHRSTCAEERKGYGMVDYGSLGMRIKSARMKQNITQEDLSYAIHMSRGFISGVETGRRTPSLDSLVAIANALHTSADELLADSLSETTRRDLDDLSYLLLDCTPQESSFLVKSLSALKKIVRSSLFK